VGLGILKENAFAFALAVLEVPLLWSVSWWVGSHYYCYCFSGPTSREI